MISLQWLHLLPLAILLLALDYLRQAYATPLRKLPGPVFARFSKLWRVQFVADGKAPFKYAALHDKYGPIVRTGPKSVDISDPAAIPVIYGVSSKFLKTTFYNTMSPSFEGALLPSMFSTIDPAYHKALKAPVAAKFGMTSIRSFEPYVDQCSDIFVAEMRKRAGQTVELADWCQYYAFDVIGAITFQRRFGFMEQGRDVDGMMAAIWKGLTYAGIIGQVAELHPWLLGNPYLLSVLRRTGMLDGDVFSKIMKITEDCIKAYDEEEKTDERGDFLKWIRTEQEKDAARVTRRDLINHLSNNLAAGSDTTAISLRAVFYFLMKNPRCYQKQLDEIRNAERSGLVGEHVSYEQCLKMPYLQAVMKEALRIHPGIGYPLERYVPHGGATISGIDLPGGTIVGINPHVIHRNREIYGQDADEFRPERWIDADPEQLKLMDRSFLAFGYGVRTCIGKNISIMEMGMFVPQILRHFDVEWASDKPEWDTHCYWMHKQSDMSVRFKPRRL